MRKFGKDKAKIETIFKASKAMNEDSDNESLDEMEVNFVRKLKRGIDKYKGTLHLKYFKYGKLVIMHLDVRREEQNKNLRKIKERSIRKPICLR